MLARIDHKHTILVVASLTNELTSKSDAGTGWTHGNRHQDDRVTAPLFAVVLHKYKDGYKVFEALIETSYIGQLIPAANAHTLHKAKLLKHDTRCSKTHYVETAESWAWSPHAAVLARQGSIQTWISPASSTSSTPWVCVPRQHW